MVLIACALFVLWPPATISRPLPTPTQIPLLAFGDSKSMDRDGGNYCRPLQDITYYGSHPVRCDRLAKSGYTAALWQADIDADLAGISEGYTDVLVNLGANDVAALPVEATWKSNMGYVLDALHAKWPSARIFVARVWKSGEVADCATLWTWTGDLLGTRAWAYAGIDETTFLEAYSTDGTHPNGSGIVVTAQQWKTVLGY